MQSVTQRVRVRWSWVVATTLALAGCRAHHWVAARDDALRAAPAADAEAVAPLRRASHGPLDGPPERAAGWTRLEVEGVAGWAPPGAVRVFDHLHPAWDGGEARDAAVRAAVREVELAARGAGWSPGAVEAIRAERVVAGMTREQVELAWGWPLDVEAGPAGERWVYRHDDWLVVDTGPGLSFGVTWGWGVRGGPGCWRDPWGPPFGPWGGAGWAGGAPLRVAITVERAVVFDAGGVVREVVTRQLARRGAAGFP